MAANEIVRSTFDVAKYSIVVNQLNDALGGTDKPPYPIDHDWVNQSSKTARLISERLETELKNYKSNLIKESIRVGR